MTNEKEIFEDLKNVNDAWINKNKETQILWRKAARKAIRLNRKTINTGNHQSQRYTGREKICWELVGAEIKRDGSLRARLIALGYSQENLMDTIEYYSPMVNDVSFRLILILIQDYKLKPTSFNVETAFLYWDLNEEISIKVPRGLSDEKVTYKKE
jgi:Reverse transcriptase (RNA-dependent DNA polymerase)